MKAYYNEWDREAAAWLRQLIKDGLITDGEVDERSITEVQAADLVGFDRVHWFAGVGTWDYCLNQAGWGDRQVWTASLPCQPFSVAGKGLGKFDDRHLLPHFLSLVRECKPDTVFGEQVNAAIKHGWLDDLHTNMEAQNYAIGHIVYGAHSIGAAHIRQRLYWVADHIDTRSQRRISGRQDEGREILNGYTGRGGSDGGMGDSESNRRSQRKQDSRRYSEGIREEGQAGRITEHGRVGIANSNRCKQGGETAKTARYRNTIDTASGIDWLYCRDNKYRPVKRGIKPLVNGSSCGVVYSGDPSQAINADYSTEARAMRLKGYGNAIVAGCGIEFISAFMDVMNW